MYTFQSVPLSLPPTRGSSPAPRQENNRAPLPEEAAALRQILKTKQELAAHLDGIIKVAADNAAALEVPYRHLKTLYESAEASYAAGQEHLHTLTQVKQNMQPSVQHIFSLLHPIRRYPTDILSLIFIAAVESEHHYDHLLECDNAVLIPRYKRRHAAIDISHVCRGWRALAHATPDMWSTVRISLARRSSAASKLALFARYAKAVPLNVIIHHLTPSFFPTYASLDSEDEETVAPLFNAVTQLRSLEIHFSHFRALSCLPKLGTSKLDHLEELSLRSDPIVLPTTPDFSLTNYLSAAPRLRKLTLTHVALTVTFHDTNFTLPTLSVLIVHGPLSADAGYGAFGYYRYYLDTHDSFVAVSLPHYLAMAPNLVKLVYFQNDNIVAPPMSMIDMPLLESVTTNFIALSNSFVTSFSAGRVNAPNLAKFILIADGQDVSLHLGTLLGANPSIRILHLQGDFDPLAQPRSQSLFRHSPSLHTLTVEKASRKFLQALSNADEDGTPLVLPNLSSLKVECGRTTTATMTATEFETLYRSRCEPGPQDGLTHIGAKQLEHFSFATHDALHSGTREVIEQRMKCVRHFENERLLLFRWDSGPRSG